MLCVDIGDTAIEEDFLFVEEALKFNDALSAEAFGDERFEDEEEFGEELDDAFFDHFDTEEAREFTETADSVVSVDVLPLSAYKGCPITIANDADEVAFPKTMRKAATAAASAVAGKDMTAGKEMTAVNESDSAGISAPVSGIQALKNPALPVLLATKPVSDTQRTVQDSVLEKTGKEGLATKISSRMNPEYAFCTAGKPEDPSHKWKSVPRPE